ncbi:MAG: MBL fold metallo-hydrolase [Nitriliruptorales bacterium]|nr:MBL fold metallo-hydrolase [Nitriliruptorales bacterium]
MSSATVWLLAGCLWLGALRPGPWWVTVPAVAAVLMTAVVPRPSARLLVTAVALLAIGSGIAGGRLLLLSRGPLVALAAEGGRARIVATVVTEPRPTQHGAWLLVRVQRVDGLTLRQRAAVRHDVAETAPALGSVVEFTATARPLQTDGFDAHLRSLHAATFLHPATPLDVIRPPPALLRSTNVVRARTSAAASRFLDGDTASLLTGLVVGDTTGLSEPAQDAMLAAGLTHLVAVSGSNVALVLAGATIAGAAARLGARGRRRVAVLAVLWFVVLVRGEPSVLRAAVMALLVLGAAATGRGADTRHTLGIAVIVLLMIDPFLAAQLGFVLSVLATGGVLVAGPSIARRLPGPRSVGVLVGATVGAQVGVAPLLVLREGGLPLGALPANLVAVPAAAVASSIGIVAALLAQVSAAAGGAVGAMAAPALAVILWSGRVFADTGALRPEHLFTPAAALFAVALLLRRRSRTVPAVAVAVVALVAVAAPWRAPPSVEALTLTALDVGQGDALLVEVPSPAGQTPARMLVDAGPDETGAVKVLRARGIRHLDVVVASHPHADHTDGLPAVLTRVTVGALLVGPRPPADLDEPAASAVATEVVAAQRGVPVIRAAAGQRFELGTATVEILGPPGDGSLGLEPNDNSLVFRVTAQDGSLLLTGDVEEAGQRRLLARPDLLRADVLKVPHHGGNTNTPGFIDAVGAHTAVIGVGTGNDYGHPHPAVLDDLVGARVLRTDIDGSVRVAVGPRR